MSKEEKKTYTIKSDENLGEVKIADEVVAIIAGLAATGVTEVEDIHHIERGYDNLDKKLQMLGADIVKKHFPGASVKKAL